MSGQDWLERVAQQCHAAIIEHDKHLRLTASNAPDHRPCESAARAKFAERLLAILPDAASPLVVIDPEDAEQVERLAERIGHLWTSYPRVTEVVQAALREFANPTPPKPDEPQGLGAVVRDADGVVWIRAARLAHGWHRPMGHWARYSEIRAVEVLSEGVSGE